MSIYIATKEIVYDHKFEDKLLTSIISDIKNGNYYDQIEKIRKETDEIKIRKLKERLPVMYPAYYETSLNPTINGIIQFDIDIKKNLGFISSEKKKVIIDNIPELAYAAISPTCGLKFAVFTDLRREEEESQDSIKDRYKIGYDLVHQEINHILPAIYDPKVRNMFSACFMTHDENAFCNNNPQSIFKINEKTKEIVNQNISKKIILPSSSHGSRSAYKESGVFSTDEEILSMLSHVPLELNYDERLKINFAVISIFGGKDGKEILLDHWKKTGSDEEKLENDLEKQIHYFETQRSHGHNQAFGNIGYLFKVASDNGYKQVTGAKRHTYQAKKSTTVVDPLITAQEAEKTADEYIKKFIIDGESLFLVASTGFGKTNKIVDQIVNAPVKYKYEILVPTHNLAIQIENTFNNLLSENNPLNQKVRHIKGKGYVDSEGKTMCQNEIVFNEYKSANIIMPASVCTKECGFNGQCQYTEQFYDDAENIRIMVHEELKNPASAWSGGIENLQAAQGWMPSKTKWIPDRVIIDESYIKISNHSENCSSEYIVIRNIVNDMVAGKTLDQAIDGREQEIIDDYINMTEAASKNIKFISSKNFISETKKLRSYPWSEVLNTLYNYIMQGKNQNELLKVKFSPFHRELYCPKLKTIDLRYDNIPKLFLDATANQDVIQQILGNINYCSLRIKSKDDINTYQLENTNFSKSRLESVKDVEKLIKLARIYRDKYDKVGIITYKNTKGINNFPEFMAKKLNANEYAHFGNLRGLNNFENMDCILILGRFMLPPLDIELIEMAIYPNLPHDNSVYYSDVPVLMKDGSVWALNNMIYQNPKLNNIKQHFSSSENIQALGRSRYVYGKKKDVYIFSNESLGTDVEISGFFRYETPKYNDAIEKLQNLGRVRNNESGLKQLGLSEHAIKRCRAKIDKEFSEAGITKIIIQSKDKASRKISHEYYCVDNALEINKESENIS